MMKIAKPAARTKPTPVSVRFRGADELGLLRRIDEAAEKSDLSREEFLKQLADQALGAKDFVFVPRPRRR